ncbi:AhpA/YtjB family protein [Neptunicella sp. SCSIO 80796]|uniref:AhpA/YtjB family protein n=1 Tax=Neptunicella plasticusilytica TaxID=3117012 RepID=UPI003A4D84C6
MSLKTDIPASESTELPSGLSIFKRLANFAIAVAVAFIIIYLWLNNVIQDQHQLQQQASQLGKTISQQNAKILTDRLIANDLDGIRQQLQYLQSDPHIHSVSLFDDKGKKLVGSENDDDIVSLFDPKEDAGLIVFVQEVYQQQKVIGYLRVLLWRDQVLQFFRLYQQEILYQAMLLVILAFLVGVLVTRGFYKLKYKLS